jgi:hypothetical protein
MKKSPPLPPHDLLLLLLALGYFAYLLGRAWHIPVTHDESATSLLLSKHNYVQLITYRYEYISANNHQFAVGKILLRPERRFFALEHPRG